MEWRISYDGATSDSMGYGKGRGSFSPQCTGEIVVKRELESGEALQVGADDFRVVDHERGAEENPVLVLHKPQEVLEIEVPADARITL